MIRIRRHIDFDRRGAVLEVETASAKITVVLKDRFAPMPIDETDKALMSVVARTLVMLGVSERRLFRRDAQYALWAIAQHLKASAGSMGECLSVGDVGLLPGSLSTSNALIRVEASH